MELEEAKQIIGTDLGTPAKMPGFAFGLPVSSCITGKKLHEVPDSVCYKCYAWNRGNYAWKPVIAAQNRRLAGLDHPDWVDAMVVLIRENQKKLIKKNENKQRRSQRQQVLSVP